MFLIIANTDNTVCCCCCWWWWWWWCSGGGVVVVVVVVVVVSPRKKPPGMAQGSRRPQQISAGTFGPPCPSHPTSAASPNATKWYQAGCFWMKKCHEMPPFLWHGTMIF